MNKLNITQSSGNVETVSSAIIDQLYNAALSVPTPEEGETDQAYMSGHISVDHAYEDIVKYLAGTIGEGTSGVITSIQQNAQGRFQDLRIDATNGLYISFADSNVKSICETTWGNGSGVTTSTLAAVTALNDAFKGNTNIVNFDEFKYFTGLNYQNNTSLNMQFNQCTNLTNITIPSVLTKLGFAMFDGCSHLFTINLQNVTAIDGLCFRNCDLSGFDLNTPNLTSIGSGAFRDTNIKTISNLGSITTFPDFLFCGCTKLESVMLPNTVTGKIKDSAFRGCTSLTSIDIPEGVTEIDVYVFRECTNLQHISLPTTCKVLNSGAFEICPSLRLSASDLQYVESIRGGRENFLFTPWNAVNAPNAITSSNLYLPNLKEVGFGAFYAQNAIQTVNLPALTNLHVGSVFASCPNLTTVTSLGNVTSLDWSDTTYGYRRGIFENCQSLTTVNLPNTLTEIGPEMFQGCVNLTNINFPSSITKIGSCAFLGMNGATNKVMYFPNVTKLDAWGVFANSANMHIYLPGNLQFVSTLNNGSAETPSTPGFEQFWPVNLFSRGRSSIDSGGWRAEETNCGVNTIYFRDIAAFPAGTFIGARIKTVIINNTTIPSLTATTDATLTSKYSDVNDCILSQINDTVLESVYVPDSALTAYQSSTLFANVSSKIKALSTCPRITVAQAESGSTGVIADYM